MKTLPFRAPFVLLLTMGLLLPALSDARVWTSTEGDKLEAIFESLDGDMITLKLRNGKSV